MNLKLATSSRLKYECTRVKVSLAEPHKFYVYGNTDSEISCISFSNKLKKVSSRNEVDDDDEVVRDGGATGGFSRFDKQFRADARWIGLTQLLSEDGNSDLIFGISSKDSLFALTSSNLMEN